MHGIVCVGGRGVGGGGGEGEGEGEEEKGERGERVS